MSKNVSPYIKSDCKYILNLTYTMFMLTLILLIDIGTRVYKLGNEQNRATYSDNTTDMQKTVVIQRTNRHAQDTTDLQKHHIYTEQ
jgi:hypothetical protein